MFKRYLKTAQQQRDIELDVTKRKLKQDKNVLEFVVEQAEIHEKKLRDVFLDVDWRTSKDQEKILAYVQNGLDRMDAYGEDAVRPFLSGQLSFEYAIIQRKCGWITAKEIPGQEPNFQVPNAGQFIKMDVNVTPSGESVYNNYLCLVNKK